MKGETNRVSDKRYKIKTAQKINRKYKDRLFRFVFRDKKDLLELYNAINGTDYHDAEELEVNTLEDVLYLGMKNDMSFLLDTSMSLYEHQSTWNENMPLRGLLYFAELYQRYLEENGYRLTGTGRRLPLPFPRYVVFYNGTKEEPDQTQLLLSDSFKGVEGEVPSLECRAVVLNINYGHNQAIMERCRRLKDYSEFIEEIRRNLRAGMVLEDAVEQGINACMERGILSDILSKSKMEVRKMLLTEYDERAEREYLRKQSREEGVEEGICVFILDNLEEKVSRERILSKLERRFSLTPEQAEQYFEKYAKAEK
ncbi:hypothetical protein B5E77_11125 [Lachnoclostridium sp. An131]|uniref:hypothetical protein n=1 Tax=Lachnoclostridium sp. An131 TaxID=1965555 RepID=UPI000B3AC667|nr:hypothetical protein [Lachnoclostridium sp. An131]OUQ25626.1 hypothetical protein B5E77_11125 [Lachnoclostridium sp. An131]